MDKRINPFNELYVSETVPSSEFVRIFSPLILKNAEPLFLPGNVVIQGVQGSGKSMLLSLLKPEIRLAYKIEHKDFPLKGRLGRFLSAGISVTRSPAIDFGQRQLELGVENQMAILAAYFADFVNHWIVYDLLETVDKYKDELDGIVARELGMATEAESLSRFAFQLAKARCWFGYYDDISSFAELKNRIAERIDSYIKFLNFGSKSIPQEIESTKTAIGEPVSQAAELLRKCGVIPDDVHVFVRIDQYEELSRMELLRESGLGPVYRQVVNKALGLRNPHVSYRIGTRPYAWNKCPEIWGTSGRLERDRNFKLVDLDDILRRHENPKTWIFPAFAEDVFRRRLDAAGYRAGGKDKLLNKVFEDITPTERAKRYCGVSPENSLLLAEDWPESWKQFLIELVVVDPLSARLGDAWVRQKDKTIPVHDKLDKPFEWDKKEYWKKERLQHALMQIAGRCGQRMIWAGAQDICELSAGNILVFVSICQHVWSAWVKIAEEAELKARDTAIPTITWPVQTVGIHSASEYWFDKLVEEDRGTTRQRFVRLVGVDLQKMMYWDLPLSYPGHNGFSLTLDDLDRNADVRDFLNDAVDYGALSDWPHTTKERNRLPRRKWYLTPILSPYFRIPHIRTKEPRYVPLERVREWIKQAENPQPIEPLPEADLQRKLF